MWVYVYVYVCVYGVCVCVSMYVYLWIFSCMCVYVGMCECAYAVMKDFRVRHVSVCRGLGRRSGYLLFVFCIPMLWLWQKGGSLLRIFPWSFSILPWALAPAKVYTVGSFHFRTFMSLSVTWCCWAKWQNNLCILSGIAQCLFPSSLSWS